MTTSLPYLMQGKNLIIVIDNQPHTVSRDSHFGYDKIIEALKAKDWDRVRELVEPKKAIINYGNGSIEIKDNVIYWKGKVFHNSLATRMIQMFSEGFPIEPMTSFMSNLMQNSSHRSVEQLYDFLDRNKLPITEDGYFLAFKKVKKDYKDIHSGTFDNSVGKICEVDRNMVDDDPNKTCSSGLHFCSQTYLPHFGQRDDPVMIVKINPKDVVSIPTDYNGAKGRCCRYEVVGQLGVSAENAEASFTESVNKDYPSTTDTTALFDVLPYYGGAKIAYSVTKDVAQAMIDKNKRAKKVRLKMVPC